MLVCVFEFLTFTGNATVAFLDRLKSIGLIKHIFTCTSVLTSTNIVNKEKQST